MSSNHSPTSSNDRSSPSAVVGIAASRAPRAAIEAGVIDAQVGTKVLVTRLSNLALALLSQCQIVNAAGGAFGTIAYRAVPAAS